MGGVPSQDVAVFAAEGRTAWVDRLRVTVIVGVICVHAMTTYGVDIDWYDKEPPVGPVTAAVLSVPGYAGLIFGLAPLYLVAGWLSGRSLARRGPWVFAARRLLRLGLPLLGYLLLLDPLCRYLAARSQNDHASFVDQLRAGPDLGPMWFVAALLAFSLVYAALRASRNRPGRLPADSGAEALRRRTLVLVAVAIALADFAIWLHWSYDAPSSWGINVAHWPQSAGAFALGAVAQERGWFTLVRGQVVRVARYGLLAGIAGLGVIAVITVAAGGDYRQLAGGWHWQTAAFAAGDGLITVTLCLWTAAAFAVHANRPLSGPLAAAADGSYAAYILHAPVLVILSTTARSLSWAPGLKLLVVAPVAVALSFALGAAVTALIRFFANRPHGYLGGQGPLGETIPSPGPGTG